MRFYGRLVATALVLLMAATVAFAAGTEEVPAEDEVLSISWLGSNYRGFVPPQETALELEIEELFGVEIEVIEIDQYNAEQMGILFASGDIPDYIHYQGNPQNLYDLGVIRSFPRAWLEELYPHIVEQVGIHDPLGQTWDQQSIDGELYAIPTVNITVQARAGMVTRRDWMEAVGAEIPADSFEYALYSDGGYTIDQIEDLLYAYRHNDPDGNGIKDTYGLAHGFDNGPGLGQGKFGGILGAFGVRYSSWTEEGGELVWSHVTEGYRDALITLADWYEQEIIDPEFVLDKRAELMTKYSNGTVGAFFGNNRWISSQADTPVGGLLANDPGAQPVYIYDIQGPSGSGTSNAWAPAAFGVTPKFGVDASDAEVRKIMEILQWRHSDEEAYLGNMYGVEGEHWNFNEEGFVEIAEGVDRETQADLGLGLFHQNNLIDSANVGFRLNAQRYVPWYLGAQGVGLFDDLTKSISDSVAYNNVRTELTPLEEEFYYRAITGEIDIAAEWDAYVDAWYASGGDEVTRLANEAQYGN